MISKYVLLFFLFKFIFSNNFVLYVSSLSPNLNVGKTSPPSTYIETIPCSEDVYGFIIYKGPPGKVGLSKVLFNWKLSQVNICSPTFN